MPNLGVFKDSGFPFTRLADLSQTGLQAALDRAEAQAQLIAAQPNKPTQERLIAKLMEMPNNAVSSPRLLMLRQTLILINSAFAFSTSGTL